MDAKRITSRDNPLIKSAAALVNSGAKRAEESLFIAEGLRLCADAAKSGVRIRRAFYTAGLLQSRGDILAEILNASDDVYEVLPHVLEKLCDTRTPQGIVCVCEMLPEPEHPDSLLRPGQALLAMEGIQNPANLGAAARTAEALGFSALILSVGSCSPYNPKALRASMGAFFRLPVMTVASMVEFIRTSGLPAYAAVLEDAVPVTEVDFSAGGILLIGNEGEGLREDTAAACIHRITIPMPGRAESLNAAAAAAILMWEMRRNSGNRA